MSQSLFSTLVWQGVQCGPMCSPATVRYLVLVLARGSGSIRLLWSTAYSGAMPSTRFLAILWQRLSSWPPYAGRSCLAPRPGSSAITMQVFCAGPCSLVQCFSHSSVASLGRGEPRFLPAKGFACCRRFRASWGFIGCMVLTVGRCYKKDSTTRQ